jgi:geranylgeranyl diphosphate synthase type I
VSAPGSAGSSIAAGPLETVRIRVEPALGRFLADRRAELAALDPSAAVLVDELSRLARAGGKRLRPALCWWAFRASGGEDGEPLVNACVALELLHTSALVHDDVMDRAAERRGVPASHVRFAAEAPAGAEPDRFGTAAAILVGDLALVLSERALRTCGFGEPRLGRAMTRFDRMRLEMATGQYLDVAGAGERARVAALKSGSYTAVGPVLIGAALAGAGAAVEGPLGVFARLVGEAFQLRDDVEDGDAPPGSIAEVGRLVDRAVASLEGAPLDPAGAEALVTIAHLVRPAGEQHQ